MKLQNKKGFTLVEVCAAILVGSLCVSGLGFAIDSSFKLQKDNRSNIFAEEAIRKEIEILRNKSFTDSSLTVGSYSVTSSSISELSNLQSYSMSYVVGAVGALSTSYIKKVTATLTWTGGTGTTYSQAATTFITKAGVANTGLD